MSSTNMNKTYTTLSIVLALIVGAIVGYGLHSQPKVPFLQGVSAVGTFQSSPQIAQISVTPSTTTGTSTFLLNSSNDRFVFAFDQYCSGVTSTGVPGLGAGGWTLTMATSSAITSTSTNTAYTAYLNVATTSPTVYTSTSTWAAGVDYLRLWPANTYEGLFYNATNTAACVIVVKYIQS